MAKRQNYRHWTTWEIAWLKESAPCLTATEMAASLDRSRASITSKLDALGITPKLEYRSWTGAEIKWLRDHAKTRTVAEMSKLMQRSQASVRSALRLNGLQAKPAFM